MKKGKSNDYVPKYLIKIQFRFFYLMKFASYTTNKNNDDIADKYDPHEAILLRIAKASG